MNEKIADKTAKLKAEIESLPEVIELEKLNKLLNEDETVMKLSYKKDMAEIKYEDSVRYFGEKSTETREAQKALYQAKLELDNNELVIKYNEAYKKVRKIYDKINEEIFNPFN
jgi:cell fate (sporulation/competence/biofilm development) regulator YlbF (YheA/YmcA/DUF963 family)